MKSKLVEEIKSNFIENAKQSEEAMDKNDYKSNNKAVNKLIRIYKKYEHDLSLAKEVLIPLLNYDDLIVRCWAATHCLTLNIEVEKAKIVLINTAELKKSLLSISASIVLESWQKGELQIYKKSKKS